MDWPPPLPTYDRDIAANAVNTVGWAFETLFWPVLGLDAQPRYDNNGALPQTGKTKMSILDTIMSSTPFSAAIQYGGKSTRAAPVNGTVPITVIALPVLAVVVAVGFLVWKKGK